MFRHNSPWFAVFLLCCFPLPSSATCPEGKHAEGNECVNCPGGTWRSFGNDCLVVCGDDDVPPYDSCQILLGDLIISNQEIEIFESKLVQISGSIKATEVTSTVGKIKKITFPNLQFCKGLDINGNFNALTSMDFGALTTVSGNFQISTYGRGYNFYKLTSMDFGALTTVSGNFQISIGRGGNFNALTSMDFGALTTVSGDFQISTGRYTNGNFQALTSMDFGALTTVSGNFQISTGSGCFTSLATLEFPSLTSVGSYMKLKSDSSVSFTSLQSILLPRLLTVEGMFEVSGFPKLSTLDAPSLQNVNGELIIKLGNDDSITLNTITLFAIARVNGNIVIEGSTAVDANYYLRMCRDLDQLSADIDLTWVPALAQAQCEVYQCCMLDVPDESCFTATCATPTGAPAIDGYVVTNAASTTATTEKQISRAWKPVVGLTLFFTAMFV